MDLPGFITWDAPTGNHPARRASIRSYRAIGRKNLEEWLRVYRTDALVADPVGPSMFDPTGGGHRGHDAIRAFWAVAIEPVAAFGFHIVDSHANGRFCADTGTITRRWADGTVVDTDLVMTFEVDDNGLIRVMRAYWEPERVTTTARQE